MLALLSPTNSTAWSLLRSAPLGTVATIARLELSRAKDYRYDPSHLYSPAFNLNVILIACFHITIYPYTKGMLYSAYYTRTGLRDNTVLLPVHFTCANPPQLQSNSSKWHLQESTEITRKNDHTAYFFISIKCHFILSAHFYSYSVTLTADRTVLEKIAPSELHKLSSLPAVSCFPKKLGDTLVHFQYRPAAIQGNISHLKK